MVETSLNTLLAAGFSETASFALRDGRARLEGAAPNEAGVYAFVCGGEVCFIGAAGRGLKRRLKGFLRKQESGDLDRKVHVELSCALRAGETVQVLTLVPAPLEWRGLLVCAIEGIADGLADALDPAWNRRGIAQLRRPWSMKPPLKRAA